MNTALVGALILVVLSLLGVTIRMLSGKAKNNFLCCAVVAVIGGVAVGWLSKSPENGIDLPLGFGLVVLSAFSVVLYSSVHKKYLERLIAQAGEMQRYGTDHFDALDCDHDGNITRMDLYQAQEDATSEREYAMAKEFDRQLYLIGHVVDSHISVHPMGGATSINVYGINRNDLASWPERAKRLYSEEYGDDQPESPAEKE